MAGDVPCLAWTQRDDMALRRLTQGSGPGIVLLPPHGRGPGDFDALAPLLAQAGLRVIRPEPHGFGPSTGPLDGTLADLAQDVAAAIEAEGAAPVVVAGAAYGNRIARMLAVLPVGVLVMGSGVGGDPFHFLLSTPGGLGCLALGLLLSWLGMVWLERIADGVLR